MLTPAIDIRFGGTSFNAHVLNVQLSLGLLPAVSSARITFPRGVDVDVNIDDDAEVILDGGEGATASLKGTVRVIRKTLNGTHLIVADNCAKLASVRPAETFEGQDAGKVISALADMAGVKQTTNDADLSLAVYTADQRHTAAEHIAHLAELSGCLAIMRADGNLDVLAWPQGSPDLALRYGRELTEYEEDSVAIAAATHFRIGNGPAGSADAPDALRPSFTFLPSDAAAPGKDSIWRSAPEIRTASDAKASGEAATIKHAARGGRVHFSAWLQPLLRPTTVVQVQDLPDGSGGPWLLTQVRHSVDVNGATTRAEGVRADAASALDGLLSLAGSALGGLL